MNDVTGEAINRQREHVSGVSAPKDIPRGQRRKKRGRSRRSLMKASIAVECDRDRSLVEFESRWGQRANPGVDAVPGERVARW